MSWLFEQSIVFSMVIAFILLVSKLTNRVLGAQATYRLWLIAPALLCLNAVSVWFGSEFYTSLSEFESIKVSLHEMAKQQINWQSIITHSLASTQVFTFAWALGAVVLSTLLFRHYQGLADYVLRLPILPNANNELVIRQAATNQSPFLFGLKHAQIIVPANFYQAFDKEQQALVLAHEAHHYRSGDNLWNLAAASLVILFWFNPFVWFGYRRFRQQQELACDEATTARTSITTRQSYAHALLTAILNGDNAQDRTSVGLISTSYGEKSQLKDRLVKLEQHKPIAKRRWLTGVLVLSLLVLATGWVYSQFVSHTAPERTAISRAQPLYPITAARQKIEGYVVLQFDITKEGTTQNVRVIESQPSDTFDAVAIQAVNQWLYERASRTTQGHGVQLDFALSPPVGEEG